MTVTNRDTIGLTAQIGSDIAAGEAGWTDDDLLRVLGASEGAGSVLGEATLERIWGDIREAGTVTIPRVAGENPNSDDLDASYTSLAGKLVRLRSGTTPVWWGVMMSPTTRIDAAGRGVTTYQAAGIASILGQCMILSGFAKTADGSGAVEVRPAPSFNRWPGGDRSSGTMSTPGGSVFVHDLSDGITVGSSNPWTAADILNALLANAARPAITPAGMPTGWSWALSDPTGALSYIPGRVDVDGRTVLEILHDLVSEQRGLAFAVSVSGTTATIRVYSASDTAVSAGTYTLPASDVQSTYTVSAFTRDLVIEESAEAQADRVVIRGACPTRTVTLSIQGAAADMGVWAPSAASQLVAGWDTSLQGSFANYRYAAQVLSGPDARRQVFRRFILRPTWDGNGVSTALAAVPAVRRGLSTTTSDLYGAGGWTGDRTSLTLTTPASLLRFADIPFSHGWGMLRTGTRQRPVIAISNGDGTWTDAGERWQITYDEDPPAILIDDGAQGFELAGYLEAGRTILLTVAIEEPDPLLVSWQRPEQDWPAAIPRTIRVQRDDLRHDTMPAGTLTGVAGNGILVAATDQTFRDDLNRLRAALALETAWRQDAITTATWTDQGTCDIGATLRPGTLLTAIIDGTKTRSVGALITRRRWTLVRDGLHARWDTTFETNSMGVDPQLAL